MGVASDANCLFADQRTSTLEHDDQNRSFEFLLLRAFKQGFVFQQLIISFLGSDKIFFYGSFVRHESTECINDELQRESLKFLQHFSQVAHYQLCNACVMLLSCISCFQYSHYSNGFVVKILFKIQADLFKIETVMLH